MIKKILVLPALGLRSMFAASVAQAECGYYAIYVCSKSKSIDGPGYTVRTDDYENFRAGCYCNIGGPFETKADAKTQTKRFSMGYVKYSC